MGRGDRLSCSIDNGVDFQSQYATGPSDGLICALFTGSRTVPVSSGNRAVDQHIFVVKISAQMLKNLFDHATFIPAMQSPVDVFSVTKTERQVTLGKAGMVTRQNRFHKKTVIGNRSAGMIFTSQEKVFYPSLETERKTSQIKRKYERS